MGRHGSPHLVWFGLAGAGTAGNQKGARIGRECGYGVAARNSRAASSGSLTVDELVPKNIWTSPLDAFVTRATTGSVMLGTALVDGRRSFRGYGRCLVVEEGTDSRKGGGDAGRRHGQRPPLQELTAVELSHQISSSVSRVRCDLHVSGSHVGARQGFGAVATADVEDRQKIERGST